MSAIGPKQDMSLCSTCPLLRVKQTWLFALHMSAYDPKRTSAELALGSGLRQGIVRGRLHAIMPEQM